MRNLITLFLIVFINSSFAQNSILGKYKNPNKEQAVDEDMLDLLDKGHFKWYNHGGNCFIWFEHKGKWQRNNDTLILKFKVEVDGIEFEKIDSLHQDFVRITIVDHQSKPIKNAVLKVNSDSFRSNVNGVIELKNYRNSDSIKNVDVKFTNFEVRDRMKIKNANNILIRFIHPKHKIQKDVEIKFLIRGRELISLQGLRGWDNYRLRKI